MKTLFAHNEKFPILWSLLLAAGLALSACSDDETAGGSSEDENTVAIENMTIMGVSQKGPFVRGSTVTANELLDGKTLKQTGNTFAGSIRSNDGLFDIKSVKLASQYAYMVVNGFYRNEVTGEESSAPITLQALTDLTLRSEANINLLTHLEYNRVVNLVTLGGLSVRKAKAQAESEVMKAFYINLSLENNFEDLNIFSAGDANAALLAISIMMQGDLAEAKFSTRLADFSLDLEADGEWDDEKAKAEIADWAFKANYAQFRSNIEGWDLSDEVPAFEKYLNNFWWKNYGLGECTSEREGEVVADSNKLSRNYYETALVRFICKSEEWVKATDFEKDTYMWSSGEDGEKRNGSVTYQTYEYDAARQVWRLVDNPASHQKLWDIWDGHSTSFQVQTAEVLECTGGDPNSMPDYGSECFQSTGGWWYGFDNDNKSGTTSSITPSEKRNDDGTWDLITLDWTDGHILSNGNIEEDVGLKAELYTIGISSEHPGVVGIGFDFTKAKTEISVTPNVGVCVSYSWSGEKPLQLELGWNTATYGDDVWYAELSKGEHFLRIPWFLFKQENWDTIHHTEISTATEHTISLRFSLVNKTTEKIGGTFILKELGWNDACTSDE